MLSGYQGGEDVGAVILDAVELVKSRNPAAVYCCDPVMGDVGRGFYVRPGHPRADARHAWCRPRRSITPNQFELEFLTGRSIDDAGRGAGGRRRARGAGARRRCW